MNNLVDLYKNSEAEGPISAYPGRITNDQSPDNSWYGSLCSTDYHHGEQHTFRLSDLLTEYANYGDQDLSETVTVPSGSYLSRSHGGQFPTQIEISGAPLVNEGEIGYLLALSYCTHFGGEQFLLGEESSPFVVHPASMPKDGQQAGRLTRFEYLIQASLDLGLYCELKALNIESRGLHSPDYADAFFAPKTFYSGDYGIVGGRGAAVEAGSLVSLKNAGYESVAWLTYDIPNQAINVEVPDIQNSQAVRISASPLYFDTNIVCAVAGCGRWEVIWFVTLNGQGYHIVFSLRDYRITLTQSDLHADSIVYYDGAFYFGLEGRNIYSGNVLDGQLMADLFWIGARAYAGLCSGEDLHWADNDSNIYSFSNNQIRFFNFTSLTNGRVFSAMTEHRGCLIVYNGRLDDGVAILYCIVGEEIQYTRTLPTSLEQVYDPTPRYEITYYRGDFWFCNRNENGIIDNYSELAAADFTNLAFLTDIPVRKIISSGERLYGYTGDPHTLLVLAPRDLETGCTTTALTHALYLKRTGERVSSSMTWDHDHYINWTETEATRHFPSPSPEGVYDTSLSQESTEISFGYDTSNSRCAVSQDFFPVVDTAASATSFWAAYVIAIDRRYRQSDFIKHLFLLRGKLSDTQVGGEGAIPGSLTTTFNIVEDFAELARLYQVKTASTCNRVFQSPECNRILGVTGRITVEFTTSYPGGYYGDTLTVVFDGNYPYMDLYLSSGSVEFLTGQNAGSQIPVISSTTVGSSTNETINTTDKTSYQDYPFKAFVPGPPTTHTISMAWHSPFPILDGTLIQLNAGCPHTIKACSFYENNINNGSFPLVPGAGIYLRGTNFV